MSEFIVVYSAEIVRRLKSRPFQLGLIFGLLGIFAFIKLPAFIGSAMDSSASKIVLAGDPALVARAKVLLEKDFHIVATSSTQKPSATAMHEENVSTWVSVKRDGPGLHVTIYAKDPANVESKTISRDLAPLNFALHSGLTSDRAQTVLTVPTDVKPIGSRYGSSEEAKVAEGVAFTLLFFLYILILVNSQLMMSSVVEEKTSRIAELLVASVSPVSLLYGKIAASGTLGLAQMILWIGEGILLSRGQPASSTSSGAPSLTGLFAGAVSPFEFVAFAIFFVLGYLQLSMLMASMASLINRTEDLGSISVPIVMPVVGGFMLAIYGLNSPDTPLIVASSFVPLVAPFVMFARIAADTVPLWQVSLSIAINLAALLGIAVLGGKIYRVGMLLYGRPPSLRQVWNVITARS